MSLSSHCHTTIGSGLKKMIAHLSGVLLLLIAVVPAWGKLEGAAHSYPPGGAPPVISTLTPEELAKIKNIPDIKTGDWITIFSLVSRPGGLTPSPESPAVELVMGDSSVPFTGESVYIVSKTRGNIARGRVRLVDGSEAPVSRLPQILDAPGSELLIIEITKKPPEPDTKKQPSLYGLPLDFGEAAQSLPLVGGGHGGGWDDSDDQDPRRRRGGGWFMFDEGLVVVAPDSRNWAWGLLASMAPDFKHWLSGTPGYLTPLSYQGVDIIFEVFDEDTGMTQTQSLSGLDSALLAYFQEWWLQDYPAVTLRITTTRESMENLLELIDRRLLLSSLVPGILQLQDDERHRPNIPSGQGGSLKSGGGGATGASYSFSASRNVGGSGSGGDGQRPKRRGCSICGSINLFAGNLLCPPCLHQVKSGTISRKTLSVDPGACPVSGCGSSFSSWVDFGNHMKSEHNNQYPKSTVSSSSVNPKPASLPAIQAAQVITQPPPEVLLSQSFSNMPRERQVDLLKIAIDSQTDELSRVFMGDPNAWFRHLRPLLGAYDDPPVDTGLAGGEQMACKVQAGFMVSPELPVTYLNQLLTYIKEGLKTIRDWNGESTFAFHAFLDNLKSRGLPVTDHYYGSAANPLSEQFQTLSLDHNHLPGPGPADPGSIQPPQQYQQYPPPAGGQGIGHIQPGAGAYTQPWQPITSQPVEPRQPGISDTQPSQAGHRPSLESHTHQQPDTGLPPMPHLNIASMYQQARPGQCAPLPPIYGAGYHGYCQSGQGFPQPQGGAGLPYPVGSSAMNVQAPYLPYPLYPPYPPYPPYPSHNPGEFQQMHYQPVHGSTSDDNKHNQYDPDPAYPPLMPQPNSDFAYPPFMPQSNPDSAYPPKPQPEPVRQPPPDFQTVVITSTSTESLVVASSPVKAAVIETSSDAEVKTKPPVVSTQEASPTPSPVTPDFGKMSQSQQIATIESILNSQHQVLSRIFSYSPKRWLTTDLKITVDNPNSQSISSTDISEREGGVIAKRVRAAFKGQKRKPEFIQKLLYELRGGVRFRINNLIKEDSDKEKIRVAFNDFLAHLDQDKILKHFGLRLDSYRL